MGIWAPRLICSSSSGNQACTYGLYQVLAVRRAKHLAYGSFLGTVLSHESSAILRHGAICNAIRGLNGEFVVPANKCGRSETTSQFSGSVRCNVNKWPWSLYSTKTIWKCGDISKWWTVFLLTGMMVPLRHFRLKYTSLLRSFYEEQSAESDIRNRFSDTKFQRNEFWKLGVRKRIRRRSHEHDRSAKFRETGRIL